MLNNLLIALLQDILRLLKSEPDFFKKSSKERAELADKTTCFPSAIQNCLGSESFTEKELFKGIEEILNYLSATKDEQIKLKSELSKAFAEFCIQEISTDSKEYKGSFGEQLSLFYSSCVEKQIVEIAQNFISLVFNTSYIVIQSPVLLDKETKKTIRDELYKDFPHSIPSFSVNKNLIGGLRIFIDGKTHDHSWISKINKLTSITNI